MISMMLFKTYEEWLLRSEFFDRPDVAYGVTRYLKRYLLFDDIRG